MKLAVLIFSFVFALNSFAEKAATTKKIEDEGEGEMNGIAYKDYVGFEKRFKLVTVRYRTDSGEQRFTFANDIAYRALQVGSTDYPDGAIFTKFGISTNEDPSFASSRVPGGTQRVQFMVRDRNKYKETGGWGYALFGPRGRTFLNDPRSDVKACYACHQIVPERGEVFSQILELSTVTTAPKKNKLFAHPFKYKIMSSDSLPKDVKLLLRPSVTQISMLQGSLRKYIFQGTLNEIRPELIAESIRSKKPAMLWSLDKKQFSIVAPAELMMRTDVPECINSEKPFVAYWSLPESKNKKPIQFGNHVFCNVIDTKTGEK